MQWSDEPHRGLTTVARPVTLVIAGVPYGYEYLNAAMQRRDPKSFLNWLECVSRTRKEVPEIGWCRLEVLKQSELALLPSFRFAMNGATTPFYSFTTSMRSHWRAASLLRCYTT